ncbi:carbamoyltransferase C-terminal domain-containing protein [Vallitalea guaymasensis]|uniref:Carbamoyltransferase n=1 Tax=Vallitalea guaymasensis TaxID=1185412 RepID=A0A8J8SB74_9FIRM|nr:carbamoyltransferase C-terminal domain-containing protein [Vallitalea guaymasensis]QUH28432.1 carbamoyltransferase [Vallitalea guaymasensis]
MKDGFYVSAYINISKLGHLYQAGHRHDESIALWEKKGRSVSLIHYWELERLTGIKQQRLPFFDVKQCKDIINELLSEYDITLDDVVEIWGEPELQEDDSYLPKYLFPEYTLHGFAHLASCLCMDMDIFRHENILAFAVDGGSDNTIDAYDREGISEYDRHFYMGCYSEAGKKLNLFPVVSPAEIWGWALMRYNIREGTLMALASASESKAYYNIEDLLPFDEFKMGTNSRKKIFSMMDEIDTYTKDDIGEKFNYFDERFSEKENRISMAMKIVQQISYKIMDNSIEEAIEKFGLSTEDTYLAMSGGFALNCPCNTYLMNKYHFKGFIAPPCVSDSGMALGIGLSSFYVRTSGDFDFKLEHAYYGDSYKVKEFLDKQEFSNFIESVEEFDAVKVVEDMQEDIVLWYEGNSEVGPRALGARSLIGDPRYTRTKDRLNEVKKRQWWRPVAPIVLKEKVGEWFYNDYESPFMLQALELLEDKRQIVPAIVHEDGTSRLQTIDRSNPQTYLYKVMKEFENVSGVPIICNTSLNDKGEPIINRIEEACNFALRKNIRVGYFNGYRILFKNHEQYKNQEVLERKLQMEIWKDEFHKQELIKKYNPYNLSQKEIYVYTFTNLYKGIELFDLDYEKQKEIAKQVKELLKKDPLFNKQILLIRIMNANINTKKL